MSHSDLAPNSGLRSAEQMDMDYIHHNVPVEKSKY